MKRKRSMKKEKRQQGSNLNPETGDPFGRAEDVMENIHMPTMESPFNSNSTFGGFDSLGKLGSEGNIGKSVKKDHKKFNKEKKPFDFFGGMKLDDD